jgi:hypothetical protein
MKPNEITSTDEGSHDHNRASAEDSIENNLATPWQLQLGHNNLGDYNGINVTNRAKNT